MQTNYVEAEKLYKEAAAQNEPAAFYYLGLLELNGYGREKNIDKAIMLYTKAAGLGYSQAQYELSVLYSVEDYGVVDNEKYLKWLVKAADNNHKLASHNLGNIAIRVGKTETGLHYLKKAAKQEYLPSIMSLSMIYYSGRGMNRDYASAFKYLTQAAELDDLKAIRLLASLHERGLGTAKDIEIAKALYRKAYQAGNIDAGYNLALVYLDEKKIEKGKLLLIELISKGSGKAKQHLLQLPK
jgi:TPR repeat protein